MMKLKQIAGLLILLVALAGCAGVVVLPIDEGLSHDQIVNRLKKLIKEKSVLTYYDEKDATELDCGWTFLSKLWEKQVSPTRTRIMYQHSRMKPGSPLNTVGWSYDWTFIDIETSEKGLVKIIVKTYREGTLIDSRHYETESKLIKNLSILKERANK